MFRRKTPERSWFNVTYYLDDGRTRISTKIYTTRDEFMDQVNKARKKDWIIWVMAKNMTGIPARQIITAQLTLCAPHEIPREPHP